MIVKRVNAFYATVSCCLKLVERTKLRGGWCQSLRPEMQAQEKKAVELSQDGPLQNTGSSGIFCRAGRSLNFGLGVRYEWFSLFVDCCFRLRLRLVTGWHLLIWPLFSRFGHVSCPE